MPREDQQAKDYVLNAIRNDRFTPSQVLSEYSASAVGEIIRQIISEKRVADSTDDRVNLSELELQNIYLLVRAILTQRMVERTSKSNVTSSTSHSSSAARVSIFTPALLDSLYKLHPAYGS